MDTKEIVNTQTGEIVEKGFSPAQIDLIKRTVCKGASDDELKLFVHIANRSNLDPFARQIYAIRYGLQLTFQTSIDGLRLIAERTGKYAPGEAAVYAYKPDGSLLSATIAIQKSVNNIWFKVEATAFFDEYAKTTMNQLTKKLEPTGMWKQMPHLMLSKAAESLVLRRAFPNETSGLYSHEEFGETAPIEKAPVNYEIAKKVKDEGPRP